MLVLDGREFVGSGTIQLISRWPLRRENLFRFGSIFSRLIGEWEVAFALGGPLMDSNDRHFLPFNVACVSRNSSQGLSKPSDLGAPIAFPASELDKLRDLPVWKTLSGKRVRIVRERHFSLQEGADIAGLPLPPGASDRSA